MDYFTFQLTILWGEALTCSGRKPSDLDKGCFFLCFLRKFRQRGFVGSGGDVSQIYGPYGWLCCVSLSCCNEAPCVPGTAETGKMNQPLYESRAWQGRLPLLFLELSDCDKSRSWLVNKTFSYWTWFGKGSHKRRLHFVRLGMRPIPHFIWFFITHPVPYLPSSTTPCPTSQKMKPKCFRNWKLSSNMLHCFFLHYRYFIFLQGGTHW